MRKLCQKNKIPNLEWNSFPLSILPVLPSPVTTAYRNKVEFTIGLNENGEPEVGFTNGNMASQTLRVDNAEGCVNISEASKEIARRVKAIVINSGLPTFDVLTNQGIWKSVIYKETTLGETMLIIEIYTCEQQA